MNWTPKYTISNALLRRIREIGEALGAIRAQGLSERALARLALEARSLSSYASTSIEGNPLPLTDVKRLLKSAPRSARAAEREVLNYNQALEWVYEQVSTRRFEISAKSFAKIQGMVVNGLMENPYDVGRLRQKPVVIRDPRSVDQVVFMPPDHGDAPKLLEALMGFVRGHLDELDPVLLAGIFHKQAVLIHPFMDGNGRSMRLMTTAILGMAGLDIFPIFSFEAYYNRNVTRYFQMVGESGDFYDLGDGPDISRWLEYFADGILDELQRVRKTLPPRRPRLELQHHLILDYIDANGEITQRDYGNLTDRSLAARKKDFSYLMEIGLIARQGGGRSVRYVLATQSG